MMGRGERRTRAELERDGKWLWEGLNRLLDLVAEEELLYHVLRRVEPPNVLLLDEQVSLAPSLFCLSQSERRRGRARETFGGATASCGRATRAWRRASNTSCTPW